MIKKILLLLIIQFSFFSLFGADRCNVYKIVNTYPKRVINIETITKQIKSDFDDPYCQAKAAYFWIAKNINYNLQKLQKQKTQETIYGRNSELLNKKLEQKKKKRIKHTLLTRKGVCQDYAELYEAMMIALRIDVKIVRGATKTALFQIGYPKLISNHAWNVIKIGNKSILVDVTWGAGFVNNKYKPNYTDLYFDMPPEYFALEHYPDDTSFLFVDYSEKEFVDFPLTYRSYFENGLKLLNPTNGLISSTKDSVLIKLLFEGEIKSLGFKIDNYQFEQINQLIVNEQEVEFMIPVTEMRKQLTIFFNNQGILTFKKE